MSQKQTDPKGLKDTDRSKKAGDETNDSRSIDSNDQAQDQVLNEEDQQTLVNPTDTEGDARGVFLDLHKTAGPGDDDDDEDDEDAGVTDPGTEIDIPFPDSDEDADDTTKKIPSF